MLARRRYFVVAGVILGVGLVVALGFRAYARQLPTLQPVSNAMPAAVTPSPQVTWSPYGEQSITVVGHPELTQSYGAASPLPTASIAKVLTALAILKQKPLAVGQQGPAIAITAPEVTVYEQDLAQNQSVVPVEVGEQLTEYQALEAMLVPSATNIADIAAPWAFGSMASYLSFANQYAASIGMMHTHIADASGFSPETVSTPQDLVQLGEVALQNPVIARIVAERSVTLPVAGTVNNFNSALGQSGINGIKTGNTDQAGGALLFSASYNGLTIVGAIMGAPDLGTAVHDAPEVLSSYENNITTVTAIKAGTIVGQYRLPWGGSVNAIAQKDISAVTWSGTTLPVRVTLQPIKATQSSGEAVGEASVNVAGSAQKTPIVLAAGERQPSLWWRLFR